VFFYLWAARFIVQGHRPGVERSPADTELSLLVLVQTDVRSCAVRVYEIRPRKDKRGVDLISKSLAFGRLWYAEPNAISNAVGWIRRSS
jgi:hypothetical protein